MRNTNFASEHKQIYDELNLSSIVEDEPLKIRKNKKMSNNLKAILGALVSAIVVAILTYLLSVGDVWKLSFHSIVNIGVLAGAGSLIKFMGTTKNNNFAGTVPLPVTPTN